MPRTRLLRSEAYGALVRSARTALGWTQEQLAGELGRDARYVQRIENEGIVPLARERTQLEKHLRLSLSDTDSTLDFPTNKRSGGDISTGSSWERLVSVAARTAAIRIIRVERPQARAIIGPPDLGKDGVLPERFRVGDRVHIVLEFSRLRLPDSDDFKVSHAILLNISSDGFICLCPNERLAPDCRVVQEQIVVPDPIHTNEILEIYGPIGLSTIYGLLTDGTVESRIYDVLKEPIELKQLDKLAHLLGNTLQNWRFIKKEIYVS